MTQERLPGGMSAPLDITRERGTDLDCGLPGAGAVTQLPRPVCGRLPDFRASNTILLFLLGLSDHETGTLKNTHLFPSRQCWKIPEKCLLWGALFFPYLAGSLTFNRIGKYFSDTIVLS